ncbi:hypothetical protein Hdeb2414_s0953g00967931 [Helianthus debilis subsp. tardiflorus]
MNLGRIRRDEREGIGTEGLVVRVSSGGASTSSICGRSGLGLGLNCI